MNQTQYEEYLSLKEKDRLRKEASQKAVITYLLKNPEKRLVNTAKLNAKQQGVEFSITEADIVIPTHCPYLGIELTNILGEGRVFSNYSIDRIDSSKGYVPGNIQVISDLANRMKQNATVEQLITFAKGVLKVHAT